MNRKDLKWYHWAAMYFSQLIVWTEFTLVYFYCNLVALFAFAAYIERKEIIGNGWMLCAYEFKVVKVNSGRLVYAKAWRHPALPLEAIISRNFAA